MKLAPRYDSDSLATGRTNTFFWSMTGALRIWCSDELGISGGPAAAAVGSAGAVDGGDVGGGGDGGSGGKGSCGDAKDRSAGGDGGSGGGADGGSGGGSGSAVGICLWSCAHLHMYVRVCMCVRVQVGHGGRASMRACVSVPARAEGTPMRPCLPPRP